jgi:hypothetical protein
MSAPARPRRANRAQPAKPLSRLAFVIGGNLAGIESANANSITDDYIGTDATGTRSLGNLGYGVVLSQATGNVVEKNDIEHCAAYGVLTIFADQNTVSSNT